jgi:hypothetical protein
VLLKCLCTERRLAPIIRRGYILPPRCLSEVVRSCSQRTSFQRVPASNPNPQKQTTYIISLTIDTNVITYPGHVGAVPRPGTRIGRPLGQPPNPFRIRSYRLLPFL